MSGLLIGILGSRVISGVLAHSFGWRFIYYIALLIMALLYVLLQRKLPAISPNYNGTYFNLLQSVFSYYRKEPGLRITALYDGLAFAGLSAFWTSLAFLLESNFNYSSDVAGAFGLFGIAGALAAAVVGKLNDRMSKNKIITYAGLGFLVSWIIFYFSGYSILGLILGVILVDLAVQALHITNQNIIFANNPEARNRVNTIYMVGFFIGGALGTSLAAIAWKYFNWKGVSLLGFSLSVVIMLVHLLNQKKITRNEV